MPFGDWGGRSRGLANLLSPLQSLCLTRSIELVQCSPRGGGDLHPSSHPGTSLPPQQRGCHFDWNGCDSFVFYFVSSEGRVTEKGDKRGLTPPPHPRTLVSAPLLPLPLSPRLSPISLCLSVSSSLGSQFLPLPPCLSSRRVSCPTVSLASSLPIPGILLSV